MEDTLINKISEEMAESLNASFIDGLKVNNIRRVISVVPAEEWHRLMNFAYITIWTFGKPGQIPDFFQAYGMNVPEKEIKKDIVQWLEAAGYGDWEYEIDGLDMSGDRFLGPGGRIIRISHSTCAELLRENNVFL